MARRRRASGAVSPAWEIVGIALNILMIIAWAAYSPTTRVHRESHAVYARSERELRDEKFVDAWRGYSFIADRYERMPVAEDATYKAGWIALWRLGNLESAKTYFEKYMKSYAGGRFSDQVEYGLDLIARIPKGRESQGKLFLTAVILEERGDFRKSLSLIDYLLERMRGTKLSPKLYEIRKRVEDSNYEMESMEQW